MSNSLHHYFNDEHMQVNFCQSKHNIAPLGSQCQAPSSEGKVFRGDALLCYLVQTAQCTQGNYIKPF